MKFVALGLVGLLVIMGHGATGTAAEPARAQALNLPHGPVTRLASPDGTRVLFGVGFQTGVNFRPQLWMEDAATHQRSLVLGVGGTLTGQWAPDSKTFAVQDHFASDLTRTYIYDAATLVRWDTAEKILATDPNAREFAKGHSYFELVQWEDAQTLLVRLHGHTDSKPVKCFELRYRITMAGAVSKLSERTTNAGERSVCENAG